MNCDGGGDGGMARITMVIGDISNVETGAMGATAVAAAMTTARVETFGKKNCGDDGDDGGDVEYPPRTASAKYSSSAKCLSEPGRSITNGHSIRVYDSVTLGNPRPRKSSAGNPQASRGPVVQKHGSSMN